MLTRPAGKASNAAYPPLMPVILPLSSDELVAEKDDAVAIFGPGEEVHLEFAAPPEGAPEGWTRRLVLETRGWCKDMDLYTKDGETV